MATCRWTKKPAIDASRTGSRVIARLAATQLFIETPYRNDRMFEALRATCKPETRLCIARDLTLDSEWIATRRIADWKAPRHLIWRSGLRYS